MSVESLLHQPLKVPFGAGYEIPPPKARVGLRVQKIAAATMQAQQSGEPLNLTGLLESIGVDYGYDVSRDLIGDETYEAMLDDLTSDELGRVVRAMGIWVMPGATREMAEASLMDPFEAPRKNRAARRAHPKAASTGSASKSTGTR